MCDLAVLRITSKCIRARQNRRLHGTRGLRRWLMNWIMTYLATRPSRPRRKGKASRSRKQDRGQGNTGQAGGLQRNRLLAAMAAVRGMTASMRMVAPGFRKRRTMRGRGSQGAQREGRQRAPWIRHSERSLAGPSAECACAEDAPDGRIRVHPSRNRRLPRAICRFKVKRPLSGDRFARSPQLMMC